MVNKNVFLKLFSTFLLFSSLVAFPGILEKEVTFDWSDLSFTKYKEYDVVTLKGAGSATQIGEPALPQVSLSFVVPPGAEVSEVNIIYFDKKDIAGEYNILPAQPHRPITKKVDTSFAEPNKEIYSLKEEYPLELIKSPHTGSMGGYRIASLFVYPLRYTPAEKRLTFYSKIRFQVVYKEWTYPVKSTSEKQKIIFKDIIKKQVLNSEDLDIWGPSITRPLSSILLSPDTADYVIITTSSYESYLQELALWKTKKGIKTSIVNLSWIESNYTGDDTQERIRNFIIDANSSWGTLWFLLAGDTDEIPHRTTWVMTVDSDWHDQLPSDLYFSDLDGDWDADDDNTYGETEDSVDMYPDVFVGRASINTVAECSTFVNKVLTYEKAPPSSFIKKELLLGEYLFGDNWGEWVNDSIETLTPLDYTISKLYESQGALNRQAVLDSIEEGYHFIHHAAHGSVTSISTASDNITSSNLDGLTNGDLLSIYVAISCLPGAFDFNCYAEHWMNNPNGGGAAACMNSRYGWGSTVGIGPSDKLDISFFEQLFDYDVRNIGVTLGNAKMDNIPEAYSDPVMRWCVYELNLFGDPEMSMWTEDPEEFTVSHDAVITIGGSTFSVNVSDGAFGVEDALVCLYKEGEVYEVGYTNASGNIILNLSSPPSTLGTMYCTVTKDNYLPYEDSVEVISPSGPWIIFDHYTVLEGTGNGDGNVDPGESIQLTLTVHNVGIGDGLDITGIIHTGDPYITLTDSIEDFGDILADSLATSSDNFDFDVSPGCPANHNINFELVCSDASDSTWISYFSIPISTPNISIVPDTLNFDTVFIGYSDTLELLVSNDGTDTLKVSSITSAGNPDYSVDISNFNVPPDESQAVTVIFSPTSEGVSAGNLTIQSDDPDEPNLSVYLLGEGLEPPDISVSPDSLSDSLFTDEVSHHNFKIYNTGESNLNFDILVEELLRFRGAAYFTVRQNDKGDLKFEVIHPKKEKSIEHPLKRISGSDIALPRTNEGGSSLYERMYSKLLDHTVFFDDMESGNNGWTTEVYGVDDLWHQTNTAYNSPTTSWWCGIEGQGDYDTGNRINTAVISPVIDLSFYEAPITLQFFENYNTEEYYDCCMVDVSTDGGTTWIHLRGEQWEAPSGNSGGWIMSVLDLSAYAGETIQIRFYFDTVDEIMNDYPGWFFDDVLITAEMSWISFIPISGTIPANDSINVEVTFDATDLYGGNYYANLIVVSNDPDEPEVPVFTHLHVTGAPDIAASEDTLDYGIVFQGYSSLDTLIISNEGTDSLTVSNISSDNSDYTVNITNFNLNPGENQEVVVTLTPSSLGLITGILTITSNDPDEPNLNVFLQGEGLEPPIITIDLHHLSDTLFSGDSSIHILNIGNIGGSNLFFDIAEIEADYLLTKMNIATDGSILNTNGPVLNNGKFFNLKVNSVKLNTRKTGHKVLNTSAEKEIGSPEKFQNNSDNTIQDHYHYVSSASRPTSIPLASLLESPFASVIPNIDGLFSIGEWNDAASVSATIIDNPGGNEIGKVYVKNTLENLYVLVDYHTATGGNSEDITGDIWLDLDNNGINDGGFHSNIYDGSLYSNWDFPCTMNFTNSSSPNNSTPHWILEYEIPLSGLGVSIDNIMGIHFILYDYNDTGGEWENLTTDFDYYYPSTWADIVLSKGVDWLSESPTSGVIPMDSSVQVEVLFDATGMYTGDYYANLIVTSNDPATPTDTVSCFLHVIGMPDIAVSADTLDCGIVYPGYSVTDTLIITNEGTDTLTVSDILSDNGNYTIDTTNFILGPEQNQPVLITFTPSSMGTITGLLTIESNDPDDSTLTIYMIGQCMNPPEISVSPDSLSDTLSSGQSSAHTLTIYNTGESDLNFDITIDGTGSTYALEFDGVDDYVEVPDNPSLSAIGGALTLECWMNVGEYPFQTREVLGKWGYGASSDDEFDMDFLSTGRVLISVSGSGGYTGLRSKTTLSPYTWTHVAGVFDSASTSYKLYINGNLDTNRTPSTITLDRDTDQPFRIGTYDFNFADNFKGLLDEVRIWNVARTQAEIRAYMNRELIGTEPGLIGYWKFNEGSGDTAYDYSSNNNDGTLLGGAAWVDSSAPVVGWIYFDTTSGTTPASDSTQIGVTFDATGLDAGDYYANIIVTSNDLDEPELIVPAHLHVPSGGIEEKGIPEIFFVKQNYPNPFNRQTVIKYGCPKRSKVCIQIFDITGRIINTLIDKEVEAGYHEIKWEGENKFGRKIANAVYFYRIQAGDFIATKKMIFIQ